jgi:spheroidene monooxygenase
LRNTRASFKLLCCCEHYQPQPQLLAALTRASIRPAKAMSFWKQAPATEADLRRSPGCLLAMGLGEAPLLRQCTFSVWQDTAAMLAYSMNGAHRRAAEQAAPKARPIFEDAVKKM